MMDKITQERYNFFVSDLILHKQYVLETCKIMALWLDSQGRHDEGKELLIRGMVHDKSKLSDEELDSFLELKIKDKCFKNANSIMNDFEKQHIAIHWKNNRHHPEYFEDINDMEEMDILEMVCDWAARSMQYGTDLVEFVETRQKNRFKFPDNMYEKIHGYCEIMKSLMTQASKPEILK